MSDKVSPSALAKLVKDNYDDFLGIVIENLIGKATPEEIEDAWYIETIARAKNRAGIEE